MHADFEVLNRRRCAHLQEFPTSKTRLSPMVNETRWTVENNEYMVTVARHTGGSGTETVPGVVVKVIDEEEPGILNVMGRPSQPKVDVQIRQTLTDDDGRVDDDGNRASTLVTKLDGDPEQRYPEWAWQWATSTSAEGPWSDIKTHPKTTTDNTL